MVSLLILKFTILRGEQFSHSHMASLIYIYIYKAQGEEKEETHPFNHILKIYMW